MTHKATGNIDWPRFTKDLEILKAEKLSRRFGQVPFTRYEWGHTGSGGGILIIRDLILPPGRCLPERTHLRLEMPPNLYRSLGNGRYAFYRNLWVTPDLQILDTRNRSWTRAPRLLNKTENGWGYLCVHPGDAGEQDNILSVIATLDLHLTNPGFKAANYESI